MNTASKLEQLIRLLNQEIELYRSMQEVVDREKEAAVRSDLDALQATAIAKEHLISDLQTKEGLRRQIVADLAIELGIPGQDVTLTSIFQASDEPHAGRLKCIKKDFYDVIESLQTASESNRQLVEHSLALLRGSFNLLNELVAPGAVYYRTGNIQSSKSTGCRISSEI